MTTEIYNKIMDKVYNTRPNKIMDNHTEKNHLKGEGKLGLCAKLLADE